MTEIDPLLEDILKAIQGIYLQTTPFKRWLIENRLENQWNNSRNIASSNIRTRFYESEFDAESDLQHEALKMLIKLRFMDNGAIALFDLVKSFLALCFNEFHCCSKKDVIEIKKDLRIMGVSDTLLSTLNELYEEDTQEEEQDNTKERVRELERNYIQASKENKNSLSAIESYLKWHKAAVLYLANYYTESNHDFKRFKDIDYSGNGHVLYSKFTSINSIYNLLMNQAHNTTSNKSKRTPLIFISHSSKDKDFAEALVDLLESLGLDNTNIFCSSVNGFGIGLSSDIFETLRKQYDNHELYVFFIHSPRYYQSPISLNEMGAAWVLRSDFCSFLTKDMKFEDMKGVVNCNNISIKIGNEDVKTRMNELEAKVEQKFNLPALDFTKWERKRDLFLSTVEKL